MDNYDMERRSVPRDTFTTTLEYAVMKSALIDNQDTSEKGITVNISNSGMCLYTFIPLTKGQRLKIIQGLLPYRNDSTVVQWTKQVTKEIYKAGLMFVH